MTEEFFFNEFRRALDRELKQLGDEYRSENIPCEDLYRSIWNLCESSKKHEGVIVASDGSMGTADFSGGLKVWYARALSHVQSEKDLKPFFYVKVKTGYRIGGLNSLMKSVEAENLLATIRKYKDKPILAIFDGSLYPFFSLYPEILKEEAEYVKDFARALNGLFSLVEKGVKLMGVVKDSEINWLCMRLLLDSLRNEFPELVYHIRRERWPRHIIQAIDEQIPKVNSKDATRLNEYRRGFMSQICDETIFDILVKEPGYTCPMALAPRSLYLGEEVKARTKDWQSSRLRERLIKEYADLITVFDELYSHPPLATFYWRPHHGLGVYRVDVPCSLLGYNDEWGSLGEDVLIRNKEALEGLGEICALLNGLSPEPYTVKPLLDVDEMVRMKEMVFSKAYLPIIQSELQKRGIMACPKKREWRDYARRHLLS